MRSVQELDLSLQIRADAALPVLPTLPGRTVGDLGCGTGCFSAELGRRGYEVRCVDVTPANLAALRHAYPDLVERGLLTPIEGDLTEIPLETASLDGAFCMEVLEHVDDDRAAIRELARVVKPGGVLVVSVPNRRAPLPLVERLGLESVHDRPGPEQHVRPGYDAGRAPGSAARGGIRGEVCRRSRRAALPRDGRPRLARPPRVPKDSRTGHLDLGGPRAGHDVAADAGLCGGLSGAPLPRADRRWLAPDATLHARRHRDTSAVALESAVRVGFEARRQASCLRGRQKLLAGFGRPHVVDVHAQATASVLCDLRLA